MLRSKLDVRACYAAEPRRIAPSGRIAPDRKVLRMGQMPTAARIRRCYTAWPCVVSRGFAVYYDCLISVSQPSTVFRTCLSPARTFAA
jgi:hypothetical protein